MLEEGAQAPSFTLDDQDGEPVTLTDLRGTPVVLYFYPKADTWGKICSMSVKNVAVRRAFGIVTVVRYRSQMYTITNNVAWVQHGRNGATALWSGSARTG